MKILFDHIRPVIITAMICLTAYLCVREICFSMVAINGLLVGKALTVKK